MFDLFRSREKSVRIMLGVLLLLVAVSMLVYLVPSGPASALTEGDDVLAQVGDQKVTTEQVSRYVENMRKQHLTDVQLAQYIPAMINDMVWQHAMAYKAREMGITVSDQEVADMIDVQIGKGQPLDQATYHEMLAEQGVTVPEFEDQERESLLSARLEEVDQRSLPPSTEAEIAYFHRYNDKVAIEWVKFQPAPFMAKAAKLKLDPADLKAYFDKNRQFFMTHETRQFDVLAAEAASFIPAVKVPDQAIRDLYAADIDNFRLPERVNVRQILVKTQGKPEADLPKLKAKAEDLLSQLKKGANFAELAAKNSDDSGTAAKGGDIGWVVRGQITEPEFESAAFSIQPGTAGQLVTTRYGYHIVQVTAHEQARVRPLEEVKGELMAELQKSQGDKDLAAAVAAGRTEAAKNPGQSEAIAKKYGLKFYHVDKFGAGEQPPNLGGLERFMTGAILQTPKGGVSPVVENSNTGDSAFVVMQNVTPSQQAEFADVQKEVEKRYRTEEGQKLFRQWVDEAADRVIKKKESIQAVAKAMQGTYGTSEPFTRNGAATGIGRAALVRAAFNKKPGETFGPVAIADAAFVVGVTQVLPANDFTPAERAAADAFLEQQGSDLVRRLYQDSVLDDLKRRGIAKVNTKLIAKYMASFRRS
jgi:peptidyl-prolyl cis-trans isomerase D